MLLKLEYANYFIFEADLMETIFVYASFIGYDKNIEYEFSNRIENFEEISFQLLNEIGLKNKIDVNNKFIVEEE
jgi:hypothetical protein